jgi:glyoxylase-like metal-dependent hydrolase (beta-lactamase superfamily II)
MIQIEQIGEVRAFRLARTIMGRPLYFTSAYLVDGLLIDTGCTYTVSSLVESLEDRSVDLIVNTHSHEDHIGGNAIIQSRFGVEVLAHPFAVPYLKDPSRRRLRAYQRVIWGSPDPSEGRPINEFVETNHHRFQVIHTPGHSPDHIALYEPEEGLLFSGDAFVGGRDRALRLDYNIWLIIGSLKKMAALEPKVLFPGSGMVRHNPRAEMSSKIDYLEEIGGRVRELHGQGINYGRIRRELFGREMSIRYYTLGHFSGHNLVRSFIEDTAAATRGEDPRSP